jgi:hypothetical protein
MGNNDNHNNNVNHQIVQSHFSVFTQRSQLDNCDQKIQYGSMQWCNLIVMVCGLLLLFHHWQILLMYKER